MTGHILALCGGVGGAKLAAGLATVLPGDDLTIIVNVGDDMRHLGLHISPDIDTVLYTLAGLADRERGWGLAGETWQFMDALRLLEGEDWFALGDRDLATHALRTRSLAAGRTLSEVTARTASALGIAARIAPVSDDPIRTRLATDEGLLDFQHYFVRRQCEPVVSAIRFDGADTAKPSDTLTATLARPDLAAVIICPSNPYLSVDPILAVRGVRDAISSTGVPCIAFSPIVGGRAIKGPTAKLMRELGKSVTTQSIASHYRGLIDALVIDPEDADASSGVVETGVRPIIAPSVMRSDRDRIGLARRVLAVVAEMAPCASA